MERDLNDVAIAKIRKLLVTFDDML